MRPSSGMRKRDESKGCGNVMLCWIVKLPRTNFNPEAKALRVKIKSN